MASAAVFDVFVVGSGVIGYGVIGCGVIVLMASTAHFVGFEIGYAVIGCGVIQMMPLIIIRTHCTGS